ncbi:MAG: hypothetical protein Q4D98_12730 [Planctomycetia bacterium]|nr:hypothetical protein [Planctomycetia bacterium]
MKKILFSVVVLGILGSFVPAWGQRDLSGQRTRVVEFLTQAYGSQAKAGTKVDPEEEKVAKAYFDWQITRWTQDDKDIEIPYYRDELLKIYRQLGEDDKSLALANGQVVPILKKYINSPEQEMIVRYNAVILLGDLNEKQVSGGKPVPLADARKTLDTLLKGKDTEPAIRVAALRGLVRHAGANIPDAEKERLAGVFDTYAFVKPPETGVDPPEVIWMRDLALQGLAAAGASGAKGERVEKLLTIVSTQDLYDLDTRTRAAQALGRMTKLTPAMLGKARKPMQVYEMVAQLAAEALTAENHRKYRLRSGVMEGFESRATARYAETMSPEENAMQIRSLRQRTKAVAVVFYDVLNPTRSQLFAMLSTSEKTKAQKIARKLRDIRDKFDKVGETKEKTQKEKDRERERNPEGDMMERYTPTDQELSFEKLQMDMEKELGLLYDLLQMDKSGLELKKRRPTSSSMRRF